MAGIGSLEDQLTISFDMWLSKYKQQITGRLLDINLFLDQISIMKQENPEDWSSFTAKWKTQMVINGTDFDTTWLFVKGYFNVEESAQRIINHDKEEASDDEDIDDIDL